MTVASDPVVRRGAFVPPSFEPGSMQAVLDYIGARERVRLPELSELIGLPEQAARYMRRERLLEAKPGRSRREGYWIDRDEAWTLVLAALVALAAGIAVAVAIRGIKGAGLTGEVAASVLKQTKVI